MMTPRENLISLLRRKGYEQAPVDLMLCPSLIEDYRRETGSELPYEEYFGAPWRRVSGPRPADETTTRFERYHPNLKPGGVIDTFGVAHEPGSEAAKHMTYMRCPLRDIDSVEQVLEYPFPDYSAADNVKIKADAQALRARGLASVGNMQMTIWEQAWCIRGMENLMMDMLSDDPIAEALLEAVTAQAIRRACLYVDAGVDILFIGDDIGMQSTLLMSESLYVEWIKPRLTRLIAEVRKINPNVLVFYHSCGFVTPLIPHLIEAGIDVLNPIQPECMDFAKICALYQGAVSFHGTIGTQRVMPFGTPEEVRREVFRNLDIAGPKGGLFAAPTHLLEPEVPWQNIEAYVQACRDYCK